MGDSQTETVDRIDVAFGADIDVDKLNLLKANLDNTRQGTVECAVAWDALKAYYTFYIGRLDGECVAYMNIAKEQARQLFGM